jgi:hypothetical protein
MREHIADVWYKRRDNNDEDAIRIEQHRVALTAMWANVYRVCWPLLRPSASFLFHYVHRAYCLLDAHVHARARAMDGPGPAVTDSMPWPMQLYLSHHDKPRFKEALEGFVHDPLFLGSWVARRTIYEVWRGRALLGGFGISWSREARLVFKFM